jgi:hemoglobin
VTLKVHSIPLAQLTAVGHTPRMNEVPSKWMPTPEDTPYARLGEEVTRTLASRFYDVMDEREPALVAVHGQSPPGKVSPATRARFSDFLVEWLGGPKHFSDAHGHPRLRMRHGHVPIDLAQRDAWMRCMRAAMEEVVVDEDVRAYLDRRFSELADFLRNRPG